MFLPRSAFHRLFQLVAYILQPLSSPSIQTKMSRLIGSGLRSSHQSAFLLCCQQAFVQPDFTPASFPAM